MLAVEAGVEVLLLFLFLLLALLAPGAVVKRGILVGEVVALTAVADVVAAALGQTAGAGGELGGDGSVGADPAGEGVLAVLDDGLAGLVAVVGSAGFTRGDGGVVDELEQVLAVAGNDSDLLAVLAEGVELVGVGSLDLLAGDVGELGLGDEGLGLGTDELLLEDDNLGGVGLLVLELGNLVGDLLFAVTAGLDRGLDVADALHGDAVLVIAVDVLVLELTNLVQQDAELVGDVGDILIGTLTPDGELLLVVMLELAWRCDWGQAAWGKKLTATSMRSLATVSRLRMTFFSILTS